MEYYKTTKIIFKSIIEASLCYRQSTFGDSSFYWEMEGTTVNSRLAPDSPWHRPQNVFSCADSQEVKRSRMFQYSWGGSSHCGQADVHCREGRRKPAAVDKCGFLASMSPSLSLSLSEPRDSQAPTLGPAVSLDCQSASVIPLATVIG